MNAEEINTRKEIEKAWLRYWDVYVKFNKIPRESRRPTFGAVAMDPELADLLTAAPIADSKKIQNFGYVTHHIYWGPPVAGKRSAVIGDCTDQSNFGIENSQTKEKRGFGSAAANYNGTLQKDSRGQWKVSFLDYREDTPC